MYGGVTPRCRHRWMGMNHGSLQLDREHHIQSATACIAYFMALTQARTQLYPAPTHSLTRGPRPGPGSKGVLLPRTTCPLSLPTHGPKQQPNPKPWSRVSSWPCTLQTLTSAQRMPQSAATRQSWGIPVSTHRAAIRAAAQQATKTSTHSQTHALVRHK